MKLPFVFRLNYKIENIIGTFLIGFTIIFTIGLYIGTNDYNKFKNDYSKRLLLGKMLVTYFKGSSAKSSGRALGGYVIGNKSPLNCKDCIVIDIGSSSTNYKGSEYYDEKYINKNIGDTVLVWYTDDFKYSSIVPKNTKADLMAFEYLLFKSLKRDMVYFYLFFLIPYIIFRISRKFLQRKHNISKEEFSEYKKIAFKRK